MIAVGVDAVAGVVVVVFCHSLSILVLFERQVVKVTIWIFIKDCCAHQLAVPF